MQCLLLQIFAVVVVVITNNYCLYILLLVGFDIPTTAKKSSILYLIGEKAVLNLPQRPFRDVAGKEVLYKKYL